MQCAIDVVRDSPIMTIRGDIVAACTLTRIIKSVVPGQAPVTLENKNTRGKKENKPNAVHVYIWGILAEACTSAQKIYK